MKAVVWNGKYDVRTETVPEPKILNPGDCIVRVTSTAICGSDLHLYDGIFPSMKPGDVLGHEFMGEVVEVGAEVTRIRVGDRVVIPFAIACGSCYYCSRDLTSLCDNSNPNAATAAKLIGEGGSALFGYSHLLGGYDGGQAEYVRVPFADFGPLKIPDGLSDESVLFLTDIFPTGYMAAENCEIRPGDVVAVWGCGPVGQFAIRSARMFGAERVIAIDREPGRLEMAARAGDYVTTLDFESANVIEALYDLTGGRGPDSCIDAVGTEAFGHGFGMALDYAKQQLRLQNDRPNVLRQAFSACRKGGVVSIPGVYAGLMDSLNFGSAFSKGLTLRMGQTHVHRYLRPLLEKIQAGEIDPTFVISHRGTLEDAPDLYRRFRNEKSDVTKVVLKPGAYLA